MVINAKKALKAVPRENNTLKGYICQEFWQLWRAIYCYNKNM